METMVEKIDITRWNQLEPKVKTLWRVSNAIYALLLSGLAIIPDLIVRKAAKGAWPLFPFALPLIAFVVLGLLMQWVVGRSYYCYRYKLGDDDLAVAKGFFWKSWRFVNRNRIQHVDLTSGPIARALGLVEVSIYVGGMPTAAATIPGLSQYDAELLRASLVKAADMPGSMMTQQPEPTVPPIEGEDIRG